MRPTGDLAFWSGGCRSNRKAQRSYEAKEAEPSNRISGSGSAGAFKKRTEISRACFPLVMRFPPLQTVGPMAQYYLRNLTELKTL